MSQECLHLYDTNDTGTHTKSDISGQPNETLEASFDVTTSSTTHAKTLVEAEIILVLCRVMALLKPHEKVRIEVPPLVLQSPVWFLRLSHTHLSNGIMDLLTIPKSKSMRQSCLNIFTSTTAPNPIELINEKTQRHSGKHKKKSRELKESKVAYAEKALASAIENEGLPKTAAERFLTFISYGNSLPYSTDIEKALDTIFSAAQHLYQEDINCGKNISHKGSLQKAFENVAKSIAQIKSFLEAISSFGIAFMPSQSKKSETKSTAHISQPSYIAVDLGLSSHYHDIVYQAILVQDNFFEEDKPRSHRGFSNKGAKIAEGGR